MTGLPSLWGILRENGFALVRAASMRALLEPYGLRDWDGFAASWSDLGMDRYMADGGRYRRRRHANFSMTDGEIQRKPHQPHYQSRDYNLLNGGLERWFSPVTDGIGTHPALLAVLRLCDATFTALTPVVVRPQTWHVELHQFRIEANAEEAGQPTPEGLHRDGVDWVLVLLVARRNIASGDTSIHDLQRQPLGRFTLTEPLDAAFVDDSRVYHGVTAVMALDLAGLAYRDVLVVTFRR
nr:2OG-Fe dioxygenase family protein [uncultured Lichenicoccus sp.]